MLHVRSCVQLTFVLALLAPATAFAQMRICEYTVEDWVKDVDEIQANLAVPEEETPNFKEAGILIEVMDREWECLVRPVPPQEILRYAQIRAYNAFHSGDPDAALAWNRAAQFMDPTAPFPDWIPEWHPLREQLEWEDPTEIITLEGKYVAHPKKGGVFMNGRFLTSAAAPSEVPSFIQVYDKKGARVDIYWQDGAGFRPTLLTEDALVAAKAQSPKWFIPPPPVAGAAVASAEPEEEPMMEEAPPVEEPIVEEVEEEPVVVEEEEPAAEEPAAEEPEEEVAEAPPEEAAEEPAPEEEAEEPAPEEEVAEEEPAAMATMRRPSPAEEEVEEEAVVEAEEPEEAVAEAEEPEEEISVGAAFEAMMGTAAACPERTTLAALQETTAKGVTAYADNDKGGLDRAWSTATELADCLGEVVDPKSAAALHRLHAYKQYHGGDADGALRSLRTAAALDPNFTLPAEVAPEGGALYALDSVAHATPDTSSVAFETPEGTKTWVDGKKAAARPTTTPSLIQVSTKEGVHWSGWVTDDALPAWMSGTSDNE
jgi:hypothetical protein